MQNAGSRLKNRQTLRRERVENLLFSSFLTNIFARTERKLEGFCKIKDSDLSFGVYELVSFGVFELVSF